MGETLSDHPGHAVQEGRQRASKLLPLSARGRPHMGIRFRNYMVLYLLHYFGWKPSPESGGIISSIILQFISPFAPSNPRNMGPDGFLAYGYVDGGEFAKSWRAILPRTSVKIRE